MSAVVASSSLLDVALEYRRAGLCVLPARRAKKNPSVRSWKRFQEEAPTEDELRELFTPGVDAVCLVAGRVSGNLELLDFDQKGDRFEAWSANVPPELFDRLVIETSQSGGRHVVYRSETPIGGNVRLAHGVRNGKRVVLIETRGEGGLFLCAPTKRYELVQGSFSDLPVLSTEDRETLLSAAAMLNEAEPPPIPTPSGLDGRPGDDFNVHGDVRELLLKHGWTLAKAGENEYWRRPGKPTGWSASLKGRVFFVFTSSMPPLEPSRAYSPFALYTMLEHNGDFRAAAGDLRARGFGGASGLSATISPATVASTPLVIEPQRDEPTPPALIDPGPFPDDQLRMPGFVNEVMDYCLSTAPYPNPVTAFCGALALQAFLGGRKVRDSGDNRTNLYLLSLAHSAAGKDWPRKINAKTLCESALDQCLGERFASGEGIQDALFLQNSMLFQTDEIDGILQSINKSKDARHESVMSTLLTLYSSANSVFPMRRKAGLIAAGVIHQPSLVIFGTAIPNHYYEALSERMLTNGFFARMLVLECGRRREGQEPRIQPLPGRILSTVQWWRDLRTTFGMLGETRPEPLVVPFTESAAMRLVEARRQADDEYARCEAQDDAVGTTVWGRVAEHTRKLSLLYAISERAAAPEIGKEAVEWAARFVDHHTRRMLFMARQHVAENPFHALCLTALRKLREAPDRQLSHSTLLKRMKIDGRAFADLMATLEQREDIESVAIQTRGRPRHAYRLIDEPGCPA